MKQRFFILLALFLIPILITGCSQENTSPDGSTSSNGAFHSSSQRLSLRKAKKLKFHRRKIISLEQAQRAIHLKTISKS